MKEEESAKETEPGLSEPEDQEVRSWVRGALKDVPDETVDVLGGVQKKLRQRSGGKFYADFWSTAKAPPTATLLGTSAIMLAIVLIAYAILFSLRGTPTRVNMEPSPIDVVAPTFSPPAR